MGLFVGDAAGATLEFMRGPFDDAVVERAMSMPGGGALVVGEGQVTDDSELAIHLWRGLQSHNAADGVFPIDSVAAEYIAWYKSNPFDMGRTCGYALAFAADAHDCIRNAAKYNKSSEANGSLMRIAPLAIWAADVGHGNGAADAEANAEAALIAFARREATLTHPNKVCMDANAAYCLALAHLLKHHGDADGAIQCVKDWLHVMHPPIQTWFNDAIALRSVSDYENKCVYNVGHVKHAFTLAVACLNLKTPFQHGIHEVLKLGGDTDTNAAIVGAMLGALHGYSAIPSSMTKPVLAFTCTSDGRMRPATYIIRDFVENNIHASTTTTTVS